MSPPMPRKPEPSSRSDRPYTPLSGERKARVLDETREYLVQKKVREERAARPRRAAQEEPSAKPEE